MAATAKIFDASLQKETDYTLSYDANGEVIARSTESDNQLKFPAGLDKAGLNKLIDKHNKANEGQSVLTEEEVEKQESNLQATRELLRDFGASEKEASAPEQLAPDSDEKPAPAAKVSSDDRSGEDGQTLVDGRKLNDKN